MREQREFLPVFAVREELLRVVRDSQGKKKIQPSKVTDNNRKEEKKERS